MAYSFNTPTPRGCGAAPRGAVLMAAPPRRLRRRPRQLSPPPTRTPGAPVNPPGSNPPAGRYCLTSPNLVGQVSRRWSPSKTLRIARPEDDGDRSKMPMPFRWSPFGGMGPQMHPRGHAVEARAVRLHSSIAGGTVVTNNHVVKDAKAVSVTLRRHHTRGEGDRADDARHRGAEIDATSSSRTFNSATPRA